MKKGWCRFKSMIQMSQSEAVPAVCESIKRWYICFFFLFLKSSPVFKLGGIHHCDRGVCNHFSLRFQHKNNMWHHFTSFYRVYTAERKETPRQAAPKFIGWMGALENLKTLCCLGRLQHYDSSRKTSYDSPSYFLSQRSRGFLNSRSHAPNAMTKIGR